MDKTQLFAVLFLDELQGLDSTDLKDEKKKFLRKMRGKEHIYGKAAIKAVATAFDLAGEYRHTQA